MEEGGPPCSRSRTVPDMAELARGAGEELVGGEERPDTPDSLLSEAGDSEGPTPDSVGDPSEDRYRNSCSQLLVPLMKVGSQLEGKTVFTEISTNSWPNVLIFGTQP
jgi:hypothetical protein